MFKKLKKIFKKIIKFKTFYKVIKKFKKIIAKPFIHLNGLALWYFDYLYYVPFISYGLLLSYGLCMDFYHLYQYIFQTFDSSEIVFNKPFITEEASKIVAKKVFEDKEGLYELWKKSLPEPERYSCVEILVNADEKNPVLPEEKLCVRFLHDAITERILHPVKEERFCQSEDLEAILRKIEVSSDEIDAEAQRIHMEQEKNMRKTIRQVFNIPERYLCAEVLFNADKHVPVLPEEKLCSKLLHDLITKKVFFSTEENKLCSEEFIDTFKKMEVSADEVEALKPIKSIDENDDEHRTIKIFRERTIKKPKTPVKKKIFSALYIAIVIGGYLIMINYGMDHFDGYFF